jgi:hypothetical protein
MIQVLSKHARHPIYEQIESNSVYVGLIQGLKAEKMLRGQKPYTYIIRAGETENDYYVTYVDANSNVRHQPIEVTILNEGWQCENMFPYGPYTEEVVFMDVLHKVMHCEKDEATPFAMNNITSL